MKKWSSLIDLKYPGTMERAYHLEANLRSVSHDLFGLGSVLYLVLASVFSSVKTGAWTDDLWGAIWLHLWSWNPSHGVSSPPPKCHPSFWSFVIQCCFWRGGWGNHQGSAEDAGLHNRNLPYFSIDPLENTIILVMLVIILLGGHFLILIKIIGLRETKETQIHEVRICIVWTFGLG